MSAGEPTSRSVVCDACCAAVCASGPGWAKCELCGLRMRIGAKGTVGGDDPQSAADPLAIFRKAKEQGGILSIDVPNADWPLHRPPPNAVRVFTPRALLRLAERAGMWLGRLALSGWKAHLPRMRVQAFPSDPPAPAVRVALVVLCCRRDFASAADLVARIGGHFAEALLLFDGRELPAALTGHPAARIAKIVPRPLGGDFSAQRNAALGMVRCPWVLQLDADERPAEALLSALPAIAAMAERHALTVIGIPRRNWVDGECSEVYPDHQYRFHLRKEKWVRKVHEVPAACLRHWRRVWALPGGKDADIRHELTSAGLAEKADVYESITAGAGRTRGIEQILRNREGRATGGALRICMITRAPFVSGAETALAQLAAGLTAAGRQVLIICGRGGEVQEMLADRGLRTAVVPLANTDKFFPFPFLRSVRALRKLIRRERADVIHANDIPSYQAASLAAAREGRPRVCHARFLVEPEGARWFLKYGAERVIAVSRYIERHLLETAPEVFRGKVVVSLDGLSIPAEIAPADRALARRELGIPRERFVFLFVGQFNPVKGLADLITAAGLLPEKVIGRCRFYLIGDDLQTNGQYRREMMDLARLRTPKADIVFPGFRRDVPRWLAAADCAVAPSHVDPLGMSVMESMAAGLPVIGTQVGGIPEMIVEGETGLLVPRGQAADLAAAMARLADDPASAWSMGMRGRDRAVRLFSLERHVREVTAVYEELLAPARSPSQGRADGGL